MSTNSPHLYMEVSYNFNEGLLACGYMLCAREKSGE
jgi:hypothetical protein